MPKKILMPALLGVVALSAAAAHAAAPGVYVTGQLAYAKSNTKLALPPITLSPPNSGLAGRLAVGYQFNQNFAVEMGYLRLSKEKHSFSGPALAGSYAIRSNAIDLVGKGILPLANNFNLYGKLGVAYLTTNVTGGYDLSGQTAAIDNGSTSIAKHKLAPEGAIGISYDITPSLSVDTSLTHIQPLGKNRPGNMDFVAVGLGYSFG